MVKHVHIINSLKVCSWGK